MPEWVYYSSRYIDNRKHHGGGHYNAGARDSLIGYTGHDPDEALLVSNSIAGRAVTPSAAGTQQPAGEHAERR